MNDAIEEVVKQLHNLKRKHNFDDNSAATLVLAAVLTEHKSVVAQLVEAVVELKKY